MQSSTPLQHSKFTTEVDNWESLCDDNQIVNEQEEIKQPEIKNEEVKEETTSPSEATLVTNTDPKSQLRSPICCVLGHVDTGKTSLLDRMRNTDVQGAEAGGITQQIGATFFPIETLNNLFKVFQDNKQGQAINLPGLLVIDTPGHEVFYNLRKRGSSLCDIAILVVDLTHGFQHQTWENIEMLRESKIPFVVALNKVDKLVDWKTFPNLPFQEAIKKQTNQTKVDFDTRVKHVICQFAEKSLNSVLHYQNKDPKKWVSMVPVSAKTGDGIADLFMLLVQLTQTRMKKKLEKDKKVECHVLDVKSTDGLGTTIDVLLVQGSLKVGDKIGLSTLNGPIITTIRGLLTPKPIRETRSSSEFVHHKEVMATQGLKVIAQSHEVHAVLPGTKLIVATKSDTDSSLKKEASADLQYLLEKLTKFGVFVHSSTLGSLEALLTFLFNCKIPVAGINIGTVHKKDVMKASTMLDQVNTKAKEHAVILAFDVKVAQDANDLAKELGVKIFCADIIYHLEDMYKKYITSLHEDLLKEFQHQIVHPCILTVEPNCVFNKCDPIIVGVNILKGKCQVGVPIIAVADFPKNPKVIGYVGTVTSIQHNHHDIPEATKGKKVAIKIECDAAVKLQFGRQLDESVTFMSRISPGSLDFLKDYVKLTPEELRLATTISEFYAS